MSFESYKSRRGNTQKLIDELNKFDSPKTKRTEDTRFWKATSDKLGNGYAVFRFLPSLEEDNLVIPFVKVFDHGFQGPSGRWYIENSLTTIGKDDPVGVLNNQLWNSGLESDKETARKQKRRLHYITNIYVIKDTAHPENEGKVFLYKFGAKIFEKIKLAMNPSEAFEDEQQVIPYDLYEGANFKLKIRKVEGYTNYDTSSFDAPAPLFTKGKTGEADDAAIEKVYDQIQSLKPFIDPDGKDVDGNPYFKSYDDLKEKLFKVLELNDSENTTKPVSHARRDDTKEKAPVTAAKAEKVAEDTTPWNEDGEDDDLAFFKKLASD